MNAAQTDSAMRQIVEGKEPRTVSPAIGEFAMRENVRLREQVRELRELTEKTLAFCGQQYEILTDGNYGTIEEFGCVKKLRAALAKVPA